jgi:hypothetical protein
MAIIQILLKESIESKSTLNDKKRYKGEHRFILDR